MASDITFGEDLLFPNEYFSHVDLNGQDMPLTIGTISKQELRLAGGGKKIKPVIEFKVGEHPNCKAKTGSLKCACQKKFVVNVTNAETIKYITGERAAEKWSGHSVIFFVGRTSSPKGIVDCLRIREKKPSQDAPPPETKKAWSIPQSWIDAIPKVKSAERLTELFDAATKNKWPEDKLKEFGEMLDARAAELKALEPPPTEPTGELQ